MVTRRICFDTDLLRLRRRPNVAKATLRWRDATSYVVQPPNSGVNPNANLSSTSNLARERSPKQEGCRRHAQTSTSKGGLS